MYSSRCRYLVTILVIMIHDVSTSLKYYKSIATSASSFIWRWYESLWLLWDTLLRRSHAIHACVTGPSTVCMAWLGTGWPVTVPQVAICDFSKRCRFSRSRKVHEILCSGAALMGSKSSSFVASVATGEAGGRVVGTGVPSPRGNCPEKEADLCLSRKNVWNRKQV